MPHRSLSFFTFSLAVIYASGIFTPKAEGQVLGIASTTEFPTKIETETAFDQREDLSVEEILFETEYRDDDDVEYGTEKVLEPGEDGTKTLTYLVTFWGKEEIDKQLIDTNIIEPKTEVISKGTKIIWHELDTPDAGGGWYWYKMDVWATKYDP